MVLRLSYIVRRREKESLPALGLEVTASREMTAPHAMWLLYTIIRCCTMLYMLVCCYLFKLQHLWPACLVYDRCFHLGYVTNILSRIHAITYCRHWEDLAFVLE